MHRSHHSTKHALSRKWKSKLSFSGKYTDTLDVSANLQQYKEDRSLYHLSIDSAAFRRGLKQSISGSYAFQIGHKAEKWNCTWAIKESYNILQVKACPTVRLFWYPAARFEQYNQYKYSKNKSLKTHLTWEYSKLASSSKKKHTNQTKNYIPVRMNTCKYYRFFFHFPKEISVEVNRNAICTACTKVRSICTYLSQCFACPTEGDLTISVPLVIYHIQALGSYSVLQTITALSL